MECFLELIHFSRPWLLKTGLDLLIFFFTPLHPKENGIQLICVGRCLNVYLDINDSIDSLDHHYNLSYVSLFYHYYNGFCSSKIRGIILVSYVFPCNTRLYWQAHSYVVNWPVDRILRDNQIRMSIVDELLVCGALHLQGS